MKRMKIFCALLALTMVFAGCAAGQKKPEKSGSDSLYFTVKDTDIALNAPAQPVLDALGAPFGMTEAQGCATTEMVRTYDYGSFYLQVIQGKEGYNIYGFWFNDDTVSTPEGIHIGSTTQEVKDAYGAIVEDTSCGSDRKYGSCLVQKGGGQLYIGLENDVVQSIQYILGGC